MNANDGGGAPTIDRHRVVSQEEWLAARKRLLAHEKELTHLGDRVSAERHALPWVKVDKPYVFEGPQGRQTLAELFDQRSQLIVYHFMFGPGWEEGCDGCSFLCDHIDGANLHLAHHDVTVVAVSRAPYRELLPFKQRMGWRFNWVSSFGSDFNYDFHVSYTPDEIAAGSRTYNFEQTDGVGEENPGLSVFYKDADGAVYHTYSAYARGGDILIGAHNWLDLTPKGRNETTIMDWVRLHDRYDAAQAGDCCGGRQ